jgi:branched-chain amino acid transport system substrate-binding protein
MKKKIGVLISVVFMVSTLLFMPSVSHAQQKTLVLGSLVALVTKQGLEIQKWNNLFVKLANAEGGLKVGNERYLLKWNTYDVGYQDTPKTNTAMQRAVFQDGVTIFANDFGVASSVAAIIADQNKLLYLGTSFTDDVVTPKFQWYIRTMGGFFSAMPYTVADDYKKAGATSWVGCTVDSDQGHYAAKICASETRLVGLDIRPPIFFPGNTVDFGPLATKIKSLNVDMVDFVQTPGEQVVNIIAALKDVAWKGHIAPGSSFSATTLGNLVTKVGDYVEGMEMLNFDPRLNPTAQSDPYLKSLVDAYIKEYGEFKTDGTGWLPAWFYLVQAIKATNSVDHTVLKNYLEKGATVNTFAGYSQLFARPDLGQVRKIEALPPGGLGIVRNGKMVFKSGLPVQDMYLVAVKAYGLVDVYQKYWDKYGKPTFPKEADTRFTWEDLKK